MGKLIDADALIFDLKTSLVPQSVDYTNAVGIALRWLRAAPEAVVRCSECRYYIPSEDLPDEYDNPLGADGLCENADKYTDKEDYCSSGKRRECEDG